MSTDESVRALNWLAKVRTYCDTHMVNCAECEFHGFCTDPDSEESIGEQAEWMEDAAKLIEQLTDQTALLEATIAGQETLQRALAESQRRKPGRSYTEFCTIPREKH